MQKPILTWAALLRCLLVFCALLQGIFISPVVAQTPEIDHDFSIYLALNTFDPLRSLPETPRTLTYSPEEASSIGVYIVQFDGPVMQEWKDRVVSAGGQLGPYIPNYAFLAKLSPTALSRVKAMPEVRWVGPYQAAYKLAGDVTPDDTRTYRVLLAPWADDTQTARAMSAFSERPVQNHSQPDNQTQSTSSGLGEKMLAADLTGTALEQAALLGDVLWIEPVYLNKLHNDVGGGTIMGGGAAWSSGYTGSGVSINVTDTGLDTGNPAAIHQDFSGRVANIASWPVLVADFGGGCYTANAGADDGPKDRNGHGTHVTGSVSGNGAASNGQIKGLAYQSTINFQAIEQWTDFSSACPMKDGYYLTGIPTYLTPLLQQAYDWGARVQNDSWGGGDPGEYTMDAFYFDSFIASHQDFAVTVSAGNDGTDANKNGYVDENSISSPATAKNVITIGASENERLEFTSTYAGAWSSDFPVAPTGTDRIANSRQHIAAFSSRGPMLDGRIKPDLLAPGTFILSTKSSQTSSTGWYAYNSYYHYNGGTSMASPLSAGAAALVREYYMETEGVSNPSAALIKATLINTAVDITGYGNTAQEAGKPIPNNHEGWGLINVNGATTPGRQFIDHATGLGTNVTHTYLYNVTPGKPFKVSLVWSDAAAAVPAAVTLVNDLNLKVTAPNGTTYYLGNVFSGGWSATAGTADNVNNVENVYIQSPAAGQWKVEVIGQNVPEGQQRYALVVDGNLGQSAPGSFNKTTPATGSTGLPTNLTLNWTGSAGATSYEYCIDTSLNSACDTAWIINGTALTAPPPGLTAGTTYNWQVRARNDVGTTEASGGWYTFTTVSGPPGAFIKIGPANGAIAQLTSLTLTWQPSANSPLYKYCVDTTDNDTCDTTWSEGLTTTSKLISGLTPGTPYYWQVQANNAAGEVFANDGEWWSFTIMPLPGAFAKTGPANGSSPQEAGLTLTWEASADAEWYEYCLDTSGNNTCDTSWEIVETSSSDPITGLSYSTTYYWQVRARNAVGTTTSNGGWWSFTTREPKPGTFSKLGPANGATRQPTALTLSWEASANSPLYRYCVDTIDNNTCDTNWSEDLTTTSKPISGLAEGTTYFWQVQAKNTGGEVFANDGEWWSFTTLTPPKPPAQFKKVGPSDGATVSATPTLSWEASSGADSYQYCYDTTDDDKCGEGWSEPVTATTVELPSLAPGATYYWTVFAINEDGSTDADENIWWSFTVQSEPSLLYVYIPLLTR